MSSPPKMYNYCVQFKFSPREWDFSPQPLDQTNTFHVAQSSWILYDNVAFFLLKTENVLSYYPRRGCIRSIRVWKLSWQSFYALTLLSAQALHLPTSQIEIPKMSPAPFFKHHIFGQKNQQCVVSLLLKARLSSPAILWPMHPPHYLPPELSALACICICICICIF